MEVLKNPPWARDTLGVFPPRSVADWSRDRRGIDDDFEVGWSRILLCEDWWMGARITANRNGDVSRGEP
ncbi:MAG: hypothetical protein KDK04_19680 [Candidatus Competibacteraceae bacterium]|nr:hypothetical protein [Candidatus Competibacteraceae bacterium]